MHQIKSMIAAVVAGLLLYAAVAVTQVTRQLDEAENTVQQLRETERELALHIQELESDIRDGTFQRSAELMAREKLGMVKPGERIFYPAGN